MGYFGLCGIKVSYIYIVLSIILMLLIFCILNLVLNIIIYFNLFNFREILDFLEILGRKVRRLVDGIYMYYCLNE